MNLGGGDDRELIEWAQRREEWLLERIVRRRGPLGEDRLADACRSMPGDVMDQEVWQYARDNTVALRAERDRLDRTGAEHRKQVLEYARRRGWPWQRDRVELRTRTIDWLLVDAEQVPVPGLIRPGEPVMSWSGEWRPIGITEWRLAAPRPRWWRRNPHPGEWSEPSPGALAISAAAAGRDHRRRR